MKCKEQTLDNKGGHMSSSAGRVMHVPDAESPYVVVLTHPGSEDSEHSFATMREAEAFIKRNTPVPAAALPTLLDRKAGET